MKKSLTLQVYKFKKDSLKKKKQNQERSANIFQKGNQLSYGGQQKNFKKKLEKLQCCKFKQKNFNFIQISIRSNASSLKSLDISHNCLSDIEVAYILKGCLVLQTLCIEDNCTKIIPNCLWKFNFLKKFRHDWMKLTPQKLYQSQINLQILKRETYKLKKMRSVTKMKGVYFSNYCQKILKIEINQTLISSIKNSECSQWAKKQMLKEIKAEDEINKSPKIEIEEEEEQKQFIGCFSAWGKICSNQKANFDQKLFQPTSPSLGIKIQKIRDIRKTEATDSSFLEQIYEQKNMPLHTLISNYDSNPNACQEIDSLLRNGYNPNTYDINGLSPFHIIPIFRQYSALEKIMDINMRNEGLMNIEIGSKSDGRNILHLSVFLKDFKLTKRLIEKDFPFDKRDNEGTRPIHLTDNNTQFLILMRKEIKKRFKKKEKEKMWKKMEPDSGRPHDQIQFKTIFKILDEYEACVGM